MREKTGAARHERTKERGNPRNGRRPRDWDTRLGKSVSGIPKMPSDDRLPNFREPRRIVEGGGFGRHRSLMAIAHVSRTTDGFSPL